MRSESKIDLWRVIKAKLSAGADDRLHTAAAFRAIVEKEESRACRNRSHFTVTVFGLADPDGSANAVRHLAVLLSKRVRNTDEVGWINEREIAVLLPETVAEGAQRLAQDIRQAMGAASAGLWYRFFVYPDDILSADQNRPGTAATAAAPQGASSSRQAVDQIESLLTPRPPRLKRWLDLAIAPIGLVLAAPFMLAIAALIKIVSPGPVFFGQTRIGLMGRTFQCLKFRTMHVATDCTSHQQYLNRLIRSDEPMTKLDETADPRIIPFGRLLRKSGLDELPQLINVLRGEMSLIGPRPCIPYEYAAYDLWHKHRSHSLPGLTGLWQVSGKNRTTFTEMMRLDIAYHRNWSLRMDLSILWRTLPAILAQIMARSAAAGHASWLRRLLAYPAPAGSAAAGRFHGLAGTKQSSYG